MLTEYKNKMTSSYMMFRRTVSHIPRYVSKYLQEILILFWITTPPTKLEITGSHSVQISFIIAEAFW